MLPAYYDEELLPPGVHPCEWDEFRQRFGEGVKRARLLEVLRTMLNDAKGCSFRKAVIFGSFVTKRSEPGDVDILWLTEPDLDREALAEKCRRLLDSSRSRDNFGCDVFDCAENSDMLGILTETFGIDKTTQKQHGLVIIDLSIL